MIITRNKKTMLYRLLGLDTDDNFEGLFLTSRSTISSKYYNFIKHRSFIHMRLKNRRHSKIEGKVSGQIHNYFQYLQIPKIGNHYVIKQKVFFNYKSYYRVDYYIPNIKKAVELDGPYHNGRKQYDEERDEFLLDIYGIETIRIKVELLDKYPISYFFEYII